MPFRSDLRKWNSSNGLVALRHQLVRHRIVQVSSIHTTADGYLSTVYCHSMLDVLVSCPAISNISDPVTSALMSDFRVPDHALVCRRRGDRGYV